MLAVLFYLHLRSNPLPFLLNLIYKHSLYRLNKKTSFVLLCFDAIRLLGCGCNALPFMYILKQNKL